MDFLFLSIIIVKAVFLFVATFVLVLIMTYVERRVSAFLQLRLGPNRVGPKGLLQPIADGIKFLMKEDIIPAFVDKPLYILAPALMIIPALMTFAVIPFGKSITLFGREIPLQVADINVGILYILALTSISVYGIVIGGWSANSKFPLLGGLRSSAQMISYELSMGLAVVSIVLMVGSLRLNEMVTAQQGSIFSWFIFKQPLAFLIFLITSYAETNRLPFDLTEAEQELVGGYHTEYSSLKFALFYMSEYINMITASALVVTMFFGGWTVPGMDLQSMGNWGSLLSGFVFILKISFFLFLYVWIRWTLPRFRYDQLMTLCWKVLLPLAFVNVVFTAFVMTFGA